MNTRKEIGQGLQEAHFEGFRNLVGELTQEIGNLGSEDFGTVSQNISTLVEKQLRDKPYATLVSAAGLGFVLGGLKASQIKFAAIHVGRLLASKAMSRIEEHTRQEATRRQTSAPALGSESVEHPVSTASPSTTASSTTRTDISKESKNAS